MAGSPVRGVVSGSMVVAVSILPLSLSGVLAVHLRREIGLTSAGLGLVFAVFFGSAAVSSSWLGRLAERLGPGRALRLGGVGVGLSALAVGLLVHQWIQLVIAIAVVGVASALTRPAANLWIARAVPVHRQGVAFGVNQSAVLIATLAAGIAVPTLALTLGWRATYVAAAIVAVLAVLALPVDSTTTQSPATMTSGRSGGDLSSKHLVFFALVVALGTAGASSLGAFTLPTMIHAGTSQGTAGLVIAASSLLGLVTRIAVGHAADRRSAVGLVGTACMIGVGAIAFVMLAAGTRPLVLAGVPLAFATAWGWLGLFNLAVIRLNPGTPGAATGITQSGAFVGGVAGPAGMGVLAEGLSFAAAWIFVAVLAAISTGAMLAFERRLRPLYP